MSTYTVTFDTGDSVVVSEAVYESFCRGPVVLNEWIAGRAPLDATGYRITRDATGEIVHSVTP